MDTCTVAEGRSPPPVYRSTSGSAAFPRSRSSSSKRRSHGRTRAARESWTIVSSASSAIPTRSAPDAPRWTWTRVVVDASTALASWDLLGSRGSSWNRKRCCRRSLRSWNFQQAWLELYEFSWWIIVLFLEYIYDRGYICFFLVLGSFSGYIWILERVWNGE